MAAPHQLACNQVLGLEHHLKRHWRTLAETPALSEIVEKSEYPDQVLLTQRSGQSYCILRQMVDTDEQWQRLWALQLESK